MTARSLLERAADLSATAHATTATLLHEMALALQDAHATMKDLRESRSKAHDRADASTRKVLQLQAQLGRAEAALRVAQVALQAAYANYDGLQDCRQLGQALEAVQGAM